MKNTVIKNIKLALLFSLLSSVGVANAATYQGWTTLCNATNGVPTWKAITTDNGTPGQWGKITGCSNQVAQNQGNGHQNNGYGNQGQNNGNGNQGQDNGYGSYGQSNNNQNYNQASYGNQDQGNGNYSGHGYGSQGQDNGYGNQGQNNGYGYYNQNRGGDNGNRHRNND